MGTLHVIISTSAAARLSAARTYLQELPVAAEAVVVGATRGAADDFVRAIARDRGATFGLTRVSLTDLAALAAKTTAPGRRRAAATQAGAEAIAARAVFASAGELTYFTPVASMPGFSRALARTVHELRLAGVDPAALSARDAATADIGRLLERTEQELGRSAIDDRAGLFRLATSAIADGAVRWASLPIVLLDVPLDAVVEREFVAALASRSPSIVATVPAGDDVPSAEWTRLGATVEHVADAAPPTSDLAHLRRHVFTVECPPQRTRAGDVRMFSAPGEG
ncbi:MAG TPA: hypothetical protein VN628_18760, partial [Vicinamibacterales bacterium]|nr:hypothetical protein [Vicinamibacterales bacterium]